MKALTPFLDRWGVNAVAESFFSSLKKERIKKQIYKNRALALNDVGDYIDAFYNRTRRHSHLGGMSPEDKRRTTHAGRVSTKCWELHLAMACQVRKHNSHDGIIASARVRHLCRSVMMRDSAS